MKRTTLTTADGLRIYDLDWQASELWAVAGPDGYSGEIDPDNLPTGFRWVQDSEWEEANKRASEAPNA